MQRWGESDPETAQDSRFPAHVFPTGYLCRLSLAIAVSVVVAAVVIRRRYLCHACPVVVPLCLAV